MEDWLYCKTNDHAKDWLYCKTDDHVEDWLVVLTTGSSLWAIASSSSFSRSCQKNEAAKSEREKQDVIQILTSGLAEKVPIKLRLGSHEKLARAHVVRVCSRALLLCPLSVQRYNFPLFSDTQTHFRKAHTHTHTHSLSLSLSPPPLY